MKTETCSSSDQRQKRIHLTQALVRRIDRAVPGLSCAAIEEALDIVATPPGDLWGKWRRGTDSMGLARRERVAMRARELGWLPRRSGGVVSENEWLSFGWVGRTSIAQLKEQLRIAQAQEAKYRAKVNSAVAALKDVQQALHELADEWHVSHEDYVHETEDGPQLEGLHQIDFLRQLADTLEKMNAVRFWTYELEARSNPAA